MDRTYAARRPLTVGLLARSGAPAAEVTSCIAAGLGMQLEEPETPKPIEKVSAALQPEREAAEAGPSAAPKSLGLLDSFGVRFGGLFKRDAAALTQVCAYWYPVRSPSFHLVLILVCAQSLVENFEKDLGR